MAIANDTFVETSDTALESHTPTGTNAGAGWSAFTGAALVRGATDDVIENNVSNGNRYRQTTDLGSGEMVVQADFTCSGSAGNFLSVGVLFRVKSDNTQWGNFQYEFAMGASGQWVLWDGTTQVVLDEVWGGGTKTIRVEVKNGLVTGFVNGVQKLQIASNVNPSNQYGGIILLNFTGGATGQITCDNFQSYLFSETPPDRSSLKLRSARFNNARSFNRRGARFLAKGIYPGDTDTADSAILNEMFFGQSVTTLAGNSAGIAADSAALSLQKPLVASAAGIATNSAALGVQKPLAATSAGIATDSATLTVRRSLAGTIAAVATDSANLTLQIPLAASANAVATDSAALGVQKRLSANSAGIASDSAALQIQKNLAGTSAGIGSATAQVSLTLRLAAPAAGLASDSASLNLIIPLAANASAGSAVSGDLSSSGATVIDLAGTVAGVGAVSAAISQTDPLTASSAAAANATAAVQLTKSFAAIASAAANLSANLSLKKLLAASAAGIATDSAAVALNKNLTGASPGAGNLSAQIFLNKNLTASALAIAAAAANLQIGTTQIFIEPLTFSISNAARQILINSGTRKISITTEKRGIELNG